MKKLNHREQQQAKERENIKFLYKGKTKKELKSDRSRMEQKYLKNHPTSFSQKLAKSLEYQVLNDLIHGEVS